MTSVMQVCSICCDAPLMHHVKFYICEDAEVAVKSRVYGNAIGNIRVQLSSDDFIVIVENTVLFQ